MQASSVEYAILSEDKLPLFWSGVNAFGFGADRALYDEYIERQKKGLLDILIALRAGCCVGFTLLNYTPKYAMFKRLNIPEIQDLNVLPQERQQGIGAGLIGFAEDLARHKNYEDMGISVGLDASFGAAQRLYTRLGYIPDGTGVTYDRQHVQASELRPIDGNLCLMMIKALKN